MVHLGPVDPVEFDDAEPATIWPPGPALLYIPSAGTHPLRLPGDGDAPAMIRVDTGRPPIREGGPWSEEDARRERKLLRALLNQALWLLEDEENEG